MVPFRLLLNGSFLWADLARRWMACESSPYNDTRVIGADSFIVQFALINGKDLTRAVRHRMAILRNEKRA